MNTSDRFKPVLKVAENREANAARKLSQLREYQAFIKKLESAISEQEEVVRQSQQNTSEHKQQWTEKHIRTQSMDKAMGRMVATEQKQRDAQEQKISDELAQRMGRSAH